MKYRELKDEEIILEGDQVCILGRWIDIRRGIGQTVSMYRLYEGFKWVKCRRYVIDEEDRFDPSIYEGLNS